MTNHELRRIAQIYGVTEDDVRDAEHEARRAPLLPLGQVLDTVVPALLQRAEMEDRARHG